MHEAGALFDPVGRGECADGFSDRTMPARKTIYPVFLPQAGCPFQCIYCNQHVVASTDNANADIVEFVNACLKLHAGRVRASGRAGEVAFYGGTFSALPPSLIDTILTAATVYVSRGIFTGIRFSTRPDCFEDKVASLIAKYPVHTVELGVQSLSGEVLRESRRGYGADSVFKAAKRVRDNGWALGIQLMAGLPGETDELFAESARAAVEMKPDFLRIYPTLVLKETALADSYLKGSYIPLSIEEAVKRVLVAYSLAFEAGIPVIRMGLHSDPALEKPGVVLAGPYHPSFGHLVICRWWRDRLDRVFAAISRPGGGSIRLRVASGRVSEVCGHERGNLRHWKAAWNMIVNVIADDCLNGAEAVVEKAAGGLPAESRRSRRRRRFGMDVPD